MRLLGIKNIGILVAGLMTFYYITGCKKDNLEYNTNYVWKNFGGVSYYYNERDGAMTNILGLRNIPEIKGEVMIYDFNNNNRFDYDPTAMHKDGAEVRDSLDVGLGKKVFVPVKYFFSGSEDSTFVNGLMQKYLPVLEDSLATSK